MSKYLVFGEYLAGLKKDTWQGTFSDIEKVLGFSLPKSVEHVAWWSNSPSHPLARVWLDCGWKSENPAQIVTSKRVVLKRVKSVSDLRGSKRKTKAKTLEKNAVSLNEQILLESGFSKVGFWFLEKDKIKLSQKLEKRPAVYAFVIDKSAVYVGVASRSLSQRVYFYSNPGSSQRTSKRINALIKNELEKGAAIEIFVAYPENSKWNNLPVNMISGLESGLIAHYKPVWNKRGR